MSDYSVEDLYEQAKRIVRGNLPPEVLPDGEQFILACHFCGAAWPTEAEMGMVMTHAEINHPESLVPNEATGKVNLMLDLVYVGEGPPPEPQR